jgi:hypothetical protein
MYGALSSWNRYSSVGKWRAITGHKYVSKILINVKCMTWPSQSPDLNIIENMWHTIKIRLQSQITDVKNRTQLVAKMKKIWISLPQHYIRSLYATIPKRLGQVIRSKGHATKY